MEEIRRAGASDGTGTLFTASFGRLSGCDDLGTRNLPQSGSSNLKVLSPKNTSTLNGEILKTLNPKDLTLVNPACSHRDASKLHVCSYLP